MINKPNNSLTGFTPLNSAKGNLTGFTLVETLIITVIFSLISGSIYGIYVLSQQAYLAGEQVAEITQNGRVILERATREIRQAREIVGEEFVEEESEATSEIMFEDGHIVEPYHYIHYFQKDNFFEREVIGFYFSDDTEQTLVSWDSVPLAGQEIETKTLEASQKIGEYVAGIKFFGAKIVHIVLTLEKKDKILEFRTKVLCRNF